MKWLSVGDSKAESMKHPMVPADSKAWKTRNSLYIYIFIYIDVCSAHFWPKEDWLIDEKFRISLSWLSKAQAFSAEENDETNRSVKSSRLF